MTRAETQSSSNDQTRDEGAEAELALISVAQRGGDHGRRAYATLVRRHQERAVRLLLHLLGNRAAAEDVAQEAFIRGYLALERYRPPSHQAASPFWAWFRIIATRLAFNHRRDAGTRRRYESLVEQTCSALMAISDRQVLEQVLAGMSYPYREILILRHVEEMSVHEVAEQLGIGLSAAKMRLLRAREAFIRAHDQAVAATDPAMVDARARASARKPR